MKFGIVVFPGSNCDHDCLHVLTHVLGCKAEFIWHKDKELKGANCLVLPGGFSYGDYLRSGAMAACSPVMESIKKFAKAGGLVLGICNGFQILTEAGLLPGALMRNASLKFVCRDIHVSVETTDTPFTCACKAGDVLKIPIAHMDGNYFLEQRSLEALEHSKGVVFRYTDEDGKIAHESNPNGSVHSIAGVINHNLNVLGLMPHPERVSEELFGNRQGLKIFESIVRWYEKNR